MSRALCRRAIVTAVMAALAWLLLPAAAVAQVVHVWPYLQPGDGATLTGSDVMLVQWFTDKTPGNFVVEYFEKGGKVRLAQPTRISLDFTPAKEKPAVKPKEDPAKKPTAEDPKDPKTAKKDEEKKPKTEEKKIKEIHHFFKYTARLTDLPFNSYVTYRVKQGAKVIREATFQTRATEEKTVRCVMVGDLAQGRGPQREVAFRIGKERPEFLVALGDIVYPAGRVSQYMQHYWGTYNNLLEAHPKKGAPLMASVPFYPVLGNHDVSAKLSPKTPDALGVYHFFSPPKNGPGEGPWNTPLDTKDKNYKAFRAATVDSFPYIDTYSFENGPAHFVVINANRILTVPEFQKWLVHDLNSTKAKWKFVCLHQPGFHSSRSHYPEQQVRQLQPIFEECGVDIVFGGHVHNYQRSVPLKFVPKSAREVASEKDPEKKEKETAKNKNKKKSKSLQVDGTFTLDTKFDGIKNTEPSGVIHIVAGGGGAGLYGPGLDKTAEGLKKDYGPNNYADFTARMVVDKHSFVVMDISPYRLHLRALGANGDELDRITITRSK